MKQENHARLERRKVVSSFLFFDIFVERVIRLSFLIRVELPIRLPRGFRYKYCSILELRYNTVLQDTALSTFTHEKV